MTYARRTTNRTLYRSKAPKSFATQGEVAEVKACQDAKINIRFFNVPIKTRYSIHTFLIDILTLPNQTWSPTLMPEVVCEIQGEFHFKNWGGSPAINRGRKDEVRRNCLISEGFRYVECTRKEALKQPELLLDRILRAWDDEYWFRSAYYLEATAQRLESESK